MNEKLNVHHCPNCGHILYYWGRTCTPISGEKHYYKCKYCKYEVEIPLREDWSKIKEVKMKE
jgi:predicted RNA-binding Zn-ribbon protein involved in translation (DUF1610 family)